MQNVLVAPPTQEPVSLAEANAWLKAAGEDALVAALIATARQAAEDYTGRAFVTQTWKLTVDAGGPRRLPDWLPAGRYDLPYNYFDADMPASLTLPRLPVQGITAVTTYAADGTPAAFAAENYRLTGDRLVLTGAWPGGLRSYDAAEVTYVAGYGTPSQVPAPIKTAILLGVQALFGGRATDDLPAGVKTLKAGDSTITRFDSPDGGILPSAALRLLAPYRAYRV